MQLDCVAIDDEPLALELIRQHAARFSFLKGLLTFNDAIAGRHYLLQHPVDLLFVDIDMPDLTGLDLVRSLPVKPMVIFTTAYRKFAVDSYELDALDYLIKPVEGERFSKAVHKTLDYYNYKTASGIEEEDALFVRAEYQLVKVFFADIEYIESVEDYLKIHVRTGRPVMTLMTMKSLSDKLPPNRFMRIHRSYMVPLANIKAITKGKVQLNAIALPIGDSYAAAVKEWVKK